MKTTVCNGFDGEKFEKVYECERCGNHVCKECASLWNGVCPNCFGRLFKLS